MRYVPSDILQRAESITDVHERVEYYRQLSRIYSDDAKVWYNLAIDLTNLLEALRSDLVATVRRLLELSPAMEHNLPSRLVAALDGRIPSPPASSLPQAEAVPGPITIDESSPSSHAGSLRLPGFEIHGTFASSPVEVIYRATRSTGEPVMLRLIKDLPPSAARRHLEAEMLHRPLAVGQVRTLDLIQAESGLPVQVLAPQQGATLWNRCHRKPQPLAAVLVVFRRLVEVLGRMHRSGGIHGGLRPDLIIWESAASDVSLLGAGSYAAAEGTLPLLHTREIWLAPEALSQTGVDIQTDIYGMGGILFFVATGAAPPKLSATIPLVSHFLAPTDVAKQQWASRLDRVLEGCRVFDRSRRFRSTDDVVELLSTGGW